MAGKIANFFRKTMSVSASKANFKPAFDPYNYTHGRWLHRNDERQKARRIIFDFDALLDAAIASSPGAKHVVDCEKKEGGFNRVFLVHLDNGQTVVARLPTKLAGPRKLAISSEVATLNFIKERSSVPVPEVLSWSSDEHGPVGTEYMIMKAVPGVQLNTIWNDMDVEQRILCIQSLGLMLREIGQIHLPPNLYGSLYFSTDAPAGSIPLEHGVYAVGPLSAPQHWRQDVYEGKYTPPPRARGPWTSLHAYLLGLLPTTSGMQSEDKSEQPRPSLAAACTELEKVFNVLADQEMIHKISEPLLTHPDFHTRNIFVAPDNPSKVTGIIDWQSAAIEPAFVFAEAVPDFANVPERDKVLDKHSENSDEYKELYRIADLCSKTWSVVSQGIPKHKPASRQRQILLSVLAAGSNGWARDEFAIRSLLSDLARDWSEIGLPGASVYNPDQHELEELSKEEEKRRNLDRMKEFLSRVLQCDRDGWVPARRWDEVLLKYREQVQRLIKTCEEESRNEEEKQRSVAEAFESWPWDQR